MDELVGDLIELLCEILIGMAKHPFATAVVVILIVVAISVFL